MEQQQQQREGDKERGFHSSCCCVYSVVQFCARVFLFNTSIFAHTPGIFIVGVVKLKKVSQQ